MTLAKKPIPAKEEYLDARTIRESKKAAVRDPSAKMKLSQSDLNEVLLTMPIVGGRKQVADFFADVGNQRFFKKGKTILKQFTEGDSFYLILRGRVSVWVNSRLVAHRDENDFIGESCVLGPCKKRSATVVAEEDSRLLEVHRSDISEFFEKHPAILKHIAGTLSDRLNERGGTIRQPNQRPELFIGSSSERSLFVKKLERSAPLRRIAKIKPWTKMFPLSSNTLESLLDAVGSVDFALLVLSPDDRTEKRKINQMAPRDNVILELGMFLGELGKERTIMLVEEGYDIGRLSLPSDLAGITYLPYKKGAKGAKSFSNVIDRVVERIRAKWTR